MLQNWNFNFTYDTLSTYFFTCELNRKYRVYGIRFNPEITHVKILQQAYKKRLPICYGQFHSLLSRSAHNLTAFIVFICCFLGIIYCIWYSHYWAIKNMLTLNGILIQNQWMNKNGKTYITPRAAVLLEPLILLFQANLFFITKYRHI